MNRLIKPSVVLLVCLSLIFSMTSFSVAKDDQCDIKDLLKKYEEAVNTKNYDLYLSVFSQEFKNGIEAVVNNSTEEEKSNLLFFSTEKMQVKNIKELTTSDIEGMMDYDLYKNVTHKIFYFYFESKLKKISYSERFIANGDNFRICIVTKENNEWKISELSSAPVESLLQKSINLGSEKEKQLQEKGLQGEDFTFGAMSTTPWVHPEPNYINVQLRYDTKVQLGLQPSPTDKKNYESWGVAKDSIVSVPFQDYIRDVLPTEWAAWVVVPDSADSTKTLKRALDAGALMIKSFSWYRYIHPWRPDIGANVNDDATQAYRYNTRVQMRYDGKGIGFNWGSVCSQAFTNMEPYVIWNKNASEPIFAEYVDTDQNKTCDLDKSGYSTKEIINYIYTQHYTKPSFGILINVQGISYPTYW